MNNRLDKNYYEEYQQARKYCFKMEYLLTRLVLYRTENDFKQAELFLKDFNLEGFSIEEVLVKYPLNESLHSKINKNSEND